jgi:hypothetical protein
MFHVKQIMPVGCHSTGGIYAFTNNWLHLQLSRHVEHLPVIGGNGNARITLAARDFKKNRADVIWASPSITNRFPVRPPYLIRRSACASRTRSGRGRNGRCAIAAKVALSSPSTHGRGARGGVTNRSGQNGRSWPGRSQKQGGTMPRTIRHPNAITCSSSDSTAVSDSLALSPRVQDFLRSRKSFVGSKRGGLTMCSAR